MKHSILCCLLLSVLVVSCRDDLVLYTQQDLKGRAMLVNKFTEIPDAPASDAIIFLVDTVTQQILKDEYLYSITAGKDGRFVLPQQPSDSNKNRERFKVVARYMATDGLVYEGGHLLTKLPPPDERGDVAFNLEPQYTNYKKGILKVTVLSPDKKDRLVGAMVYLFTNETQASTLGDAIPQGVAVPAQTSAAGVATFGNLESNTYWLGAKLGELKTTITSIKVGPASQLTTLATAQVTLTLKPELSITVLERLTNMPLAGLKTYLFVNQTQAYTIDSTTVQGATPEKLTDAKGQVSFKPVELSTPYFVGVIRPVGIKKKTALTGPVVITSTAPAALTLLLD